MKTTGGDHGGVSRGRGASLNPEGRFESTARQPQDDGWFPEPVEGSARPRTEVTDERAKTVLSRHDSPDLDFTQSINPYRGCEPINIGSNTDGYQPIERQRRITRSILEVLHETSHPVAIITKSALVERDLDLLVPMAGAGLVAVAISVTTLDAGLARRMEPRASVPVRRIEAVRRLTEAGVPVGVNVSPIIPFLTDHEMESILEAAAEAGAGWASWTLVRLPWEVKDLFRAWLEEHVPLKAAHVMSRLQEMRGGRDHFRPPTTSGQMGLF